MKQEKKSKITVYKLNVGVFEIRISEAKLEIENDSKNWKIVFGSDTIPYGVIVRMHSMNKYDAIETLCTGLYGTMSMAVSPEVLKGFLELLANERKNISAKG